MVALGAAVAVEVDAPLLLPDEVELELPELDEVAAVESVLAAVVAFVVATVVLVDADAARTLPPWPVAARPPMSAVAPAATVAVIAVSRLTRRRFRSRRSIGSRVLIVRHLSSHL